MPTTRVAERTGMPLRTVQRHLQRLAELCLVVAVPGGPGHRWVRMADIVPDAAADEGAAAALAALEAVHAAAAAGNPAAAQGVLPFCDALVAPARP